ncbi:MAG TPA: sulfite exporter TauE/SafE family protein [Clostridiales bacterium]|nr:sulfite exporter TauE/SafE family protein [Clostridiales bacterium]
MIFILIGLLAGIIGGMGIGGGTILIPALTLITDVSQHQAQGLNLLSFIPAALVASITYFKNKNIEFSLLLPLIVSGTIGSVCGSLFAVHLSSSLLRKLFGIFLIGIGLYELFWKEKSRMS